MANMPQKIPSDSLPPMLVQAMEAIQQGNLSNVNIEISREPTLRTTLTANSPDGENRIILTTESYSGVSEVQQTQISKPANKEERLDRVEKLHKEGKTQTEIAKYTMTSQKTVSNDIKELRKKGKIK